MMKFAKSSLQLVTPCFTAQGALSCTGTDMESMNPPQIQTSLGFIIWVGPVASPTGPLKSSPTCVGSLGTGKHMVGGSALTPTPPVVPTQSAARRPRQRTEATAVCVFV